MKWKVKVLLPEVSLKKIHPLDIKGDQMEGQSGVTPNIIDELHSCDIQLDEMDGESGVTRSIID